MQNPNVAWLKTATPDIWLAHLDYVLGEKVWGFRSATVGGASAPSWAVVLDYEQAIRREAVKKIVYEGHDVKAALEAARKDAELKEAHFVTKALFDMVAPLRGRTPAPPGLSTGPGPYGGKGKGKFRKGKGKGKGKAETSATGLARNTPEGQPICFAYNDPGSKCKGFYGRAHVCRKCFGSHPVHLCNKEAAKRPE